MESENINVRQTLINFLQHFWDENYNTKSLALDEYVDKYLCSDKYLNCINPKHCNTCVWFGSGKKCQDCEDWSEYEEETKI